MATRNKQQAQDVVRAKMVVAQSVHIVNDTGSIVAELGSDTHNRARLDLYGHESRGKSAPIIASLHVDETGASLSFCGPMRQPVIQLAVTPAREPLLAVWDTDGKPLATAPLNLLQHLGQIKDVLEAIETSVQRSLERVRADHAEPTGTEDAPEA